MRNSKMKGFTLIELIVVIAIIGILAAILVPSMLGYVRDARIQAANANAKQVHTALQAALTKANIAGITLSADGDDDNLGFTSAVFSKVSTETTSTIIAPIDGYPDDPGGPDLYEYLGETFEGSAYAAYDKKAYAVLWSSWAKDSGSVWQGEARTSLTASEQEAACKEGNIIFGVHPLLPMDSSDETEPK